MANVANTAATGPASKDTVSGGKMLSNATRKSSDGSGFPKPAGAVSESSFKKLRVQSTGFGTNIESALKGQKAPR